VTVGGFVDDLGLDFLLWVWLLAAKPTGLGAGV
jgi:hypothetical protein